MFNSRLPPHSMAGNTTNTVQGSYLEDGFPTNGQAKELPIPRKKRLWRDAPRTTPFSAKQGQQPLFPRDKRNLRYATPGPLGPLTEVPLIQHHTS